MHRLKEITFLFIDAQHQKRVTRGPLLFADKLCARVSRRGWEVGREKGAVRYTPVRRQSGFCRHTQFVKLPRHNEPCIFPADFPRRNSGQRCRTSNPRRVARPRRHTVDVFVFTSSVLFSRFALSRILSLSPSLSFSLLAASLRCLLRSRAKLHSKINIKVRVIRV